MLAHVATVIGLLSASLATSLVLARMLKCIPLTQAQAEGAVKSRFLTPATIIAGIAGFTLLLTLIGYGIFANAPRALPVFTTIPFAVVMIFAVMLFLKNRQSIFPSVLTLAGLVFIWVAPLIARGVSESVSWLDMINFYDGYISSSTSSSNYATFEISAAPKKTLQYTMLEYQADNKRLRHAGSITLDEKTRMLKIDENPPCKVSKLVTDDGVVLTITSTTKEFPQFKFKSMKEAQP